MRVVRVARPGEVEHKVHNNNQRSSQVRVRVRSVFLLFASIKLAEMIPIKTYSVCLASLLVDVEGSSQACPREEVQRSLLLSYRFLGHVRYMLYTKPFRVLRSYEGLVDLKYY